MAARVFWSEHCVVHAASCNCILCKAEKIKPELPIARVVPPWWVRVWGVGALAFFLGCRPPCDCEEPISNHEPFKPADPVELGNTANWKKDCLALNSRFFCAVNYLPGRIVGDIRCGCCPPEYSMAECQVMLLQ